jgi:hypothetical protein
MLFRYKIDIYCKSNNSRTNNQNINRSIIYIICDRTNYIKRKLASISFLFGIRFYFLRILSRDFRICVLIILIYSLKLYRIIIIGFIKRSDVYSYNNNNSISNIRFYKYYY